MNEQPTPISSDRSPTQQTALQLPALIGASPGEFWLIVAPFRVREIELQLIPRLALRGEVHVIVGGHSYDVDGVLRGVRRLTPDVAAVARRIQGRRAPTCFQMRALLKNTPDLTDPLIVLNFLSGYLSDEEQLWKSRYLLEDSLAELSRIRQRATVLVTARPPESGQRAHWQLFDLLRGAADKLVKFTHAPPPQQMSLF